MSAPRAYRPSLGFFAMLFIYVATVGLIGWGLRTPELDRVWTLEHALKAGQRSELSSQDRALFERAFASHPGLAAGLLDGRTMGLLSTDRAGWCSRGAAVLARLAGPDRQIDVRIDSPPEDYPVRVELEGSSWRRALTFEQSGEARITLPKVEHAELVAVTSRGGVDGREPVAFAISIEEDP